jgi:NAD(P)-dependent dehydrogenase (short-subunit alcohol dehydrogenase family)
VATPLIPSTFPPEKVEKFGQQVPMGRAAQPDEIAPSYVFLAAPQYSSYPLLSQANWLFDLPARRWAAPGLPGS